jgi:hypothetical protein
MRYYKNMYVDGDIAQGVIEKMKKEQPSFNVYAVCVYGGMTSLFEILSTTELFKEHNKKKNYAVVAVVNGKAAAETAVAVILKNWLEKHKDLSEIQNYYNNNSV